MARVALTIQKIERERIFNMRKMLLYLALAVALSLGAVAQTTNDASAQDSQATTATSSKKAKKAGKVKTEHQVTGCLQGPNDEGVYVLTNGRYKKGLEVGGNDGLRNHVGHEVTLLGTWASGQDIGENAATESKAEKVKSKVGMEKHFKVTEIKMKSETCAPTATGTKKKMKKSAAATAQP